ncbi:MAG: hypothetical protein AAFN07_07240 [Pseudomonadota bacterium]
MDTGFEEKSAWIQLVTLTVVVGGYFLVASQMHAAGVQDIRAYVPVFTVSVIALIIVMIFGHIAAVAITRNDDRDERDKVIAWRSEYLSSWIVGVGVLAGITAMVLGIDTVLVAHGLLLSLLVSELLSSSLKIVFYRRGF